MPDLADRAVWEQLTAVLDAADAQLLERAALCEPAEHAYAKGKLEGLRHALALLTQSRRDLVKASGDVLA